MIDAGFADWQRQVIECMDCLFDPAHRGLAPLVFVDALEVYRLGMTPEQAARGYLNLDRAAFDRMLKASREAA